MSVDLPVVLDILSTSVDGTTQWRIDATVACVAGEPRVVRCTFESSHGLELRRLQREFRWATPIDVVTRALPQLLADGRDPYTHDFAQRGYPDAADLLGTPHRRLSDEFLRDVAQRYVDIGRGYSKQLAEQYQVAPRTVVSWVQKARRRGLLTPARPGVAGGEVRPS